MENKLIRTSVRSLVSAAVWTLTPVLAPFLVAGNAAYDRMTIAVGLGIAVSELWQNGRSRRDPVRWSDGRILFTTFLPALLAVASALAGLHARAWLWAAAAAIMAGTTVWAGRKERAESSFGPDGFRSFLPWKLGLLVAGLAFVAGPVLAPWDPPAQAFVRWHPFSTNEELVWRMIFLGYALGFFWTVWNGPQRQRSFLLLVGVSGVFHATEMLADNLVSASRNHVNGNPEHLYGDVAGWFVIALLALLMLRVARTAR